MRGALTRKNTRQLLALLFLEKGSVSEYAYRPESEFKGIEEDVGDRTNFINVLLFIAQLVCLIISVIWLGTPQARDGRDGWLRTGVGLPFGCAVVLLAIKRISGWYVFRGLWDIRRNYNDTLRTPLFDAGDASRPQVGNARTIALQAIDRHLKEIDGRRWGGAVLRVHSGLAYYVPIGHRFLWWWTLFVGIGAVLNSSTGKNQLQFTDVITDVMRALLIALVANIATNIIRELLVLRSQYASTADKVRGIDAALLRHARALDETVRNIKTSIFDGTAELAIDRLASTLQQFHKRLRKAPGSEASRLEQDYFLNYTEALARNAAELLRMYEWPEHGLFGAAAMTSIVEEQRPSEGHHLVRLSTLAKIAKEICRAVDNLAQADGNRGLHIYALVAISPQRFLNKGLGKGPADDLNTYVCGHENFEHYLEYFADRAQCTRWDDGEEPKHFHVETHRYFLSIADAENDEQSSSLSGQSLCSEFYALRASSVQEELRLLVDVEPRVPKSSSPGGYRDVRKLARREPVPSQPGQMRYAVRRGAPDNSSVETVGSVLSQLYHRPGQCKVLEVHAKEAIHCLQDELTSKPKDYFAVAMNGKWVFCLRSLYDSDLDVADVEILRTDSNQVPAEGATRWNEVVSELDRLFSRTVPGGLGNLYDIDSYRPRAEDRSRDPESLLPG